MPDSPGFKQVPGYRGLLPDTVIQVMFPFQPDGNGEDAARHWRGKAMIEWSRLSMKSRFSREEPVTEQFDGASR